MSLISPPRIRVTVLGDAERDRLMRFLLSDSTGSLFLQSLVHEHGVTATPDMEHGRFFGGWRGEDLVSVAFLGNSRNLTTMGDARDLTQVMARVFREPLRPRLFVGPAEHAPLVRRAFASDQCVPCLDREQVYAVLRPEALNELPGIEIELARPEDVEQVARAQAAMTAEDLRIPRGHIDLDRLRVISRQRIAEGKVWVVRKGRDLVFKTEEAARTPDGLLVGGVYTKPSQRGQGYAARGIAAWARRLFAEGLSVVALHVNAENGPALRAYLRVGFRPYATLRLILAY